MFARIGGIMSKQQKGNKESKKPKVVSKDVKKQKKDPKRHDGVITKLFDTSK